MRTPHPRDLPELVAELTERVTELEARIDAPAGDELTADTPPTADELERDNKRDELDELARDAGVESPAELPNKGAVAAAIVETY